MHKIYKISHGSPIDYAAEELRKYLKMMMPDSGSFDVYYNDAATDGYRLGLMSDFGLDTSDAEDSALDDIIYIDTKGKAGIISGSNPRAVLIAVYEYLRQNGCEWVMPGLDGEIIPMREVGDVKYRFKPTMRYRGWVLEGWIYQRAEMDAIEFAPKLGLNTFMIQFKYPKRCYERYYERFHNPARPLDMISDDTVLGWKRMLEAEMQKRGVMFHDIGHGFTYEPLGIPMSSGWDTEYDEKLDDVTRGMLAEINGKRGIFYMPLNTNFCMSNESARKMVADYTVKYAREHSNIDYLHIWLADANNNHCECSECRRKRPSDFYVMMLNEIDEALSLAGLDTKIVFIAYMDTAWAPLMEKIKNPERFLLMIAPITRDYTETLPNGIASELAPFERNKLQMPRSLGEFFAHIKRWKTGFSGDKISFEYHIWRPMYLDVSGIKISEVIVDDVREYLNQGFDGILECGTQRCFSPTGLLFYTFARSAYNKDLSAEEIRERYFGVLFGDFKEEIAEYLKRLEDVYSMKYLAKQKSSNPLVSVYYNPEYSKKIKSMEELCDEGREMLKSHLDSSCRARTVAVQILLAYNEIMRYFARAMCAKARGRDKAAKTIYEEMKFEIGKLEPQIEQYYDHGQFMDYLRIIFDCTVSNLPQNDYM